MLLGYLNSFPFHFVFTSTPTPEIGRNCFTQDETKVYAQMG